jgi:epoxyqueuosine reductase
MEPEDIIGLIKTNLLNRGFRMSTGRIGHLQELKNEIEGLYHQGLIDSGLFRQYLSHLNYSPSAGKTNPVSFILTAAPQTQQGITFNYHDREYYYPIPPTYYTKTDETIEKIISDSLIPLGYSLSPANFPFKSAAVRTGLARYGRNNITYCDGLGSYYRLKAFVTDLPVYQDSWQPAELMPRCENCTACLKACPTGAITGKRLLIHAERCLTYFNENLDDFPEWINRSWQRCLVGCMICQKVCPENKGFNIEPEINSTFSEEETNPFLNTLHEDDLPESVIYKLEKLSLLEYRASISRNLKIMLLRCRE